MEGKRKLQGKSPRVHGMVDAFRYRVCQKQAHIFLTPSLIGRGAVRPSLLVLPFFSKYLEATHT